MFRLYPIFRVLSVFLLFTSILHSVETKKKKREVPPKPTKAISWNDLTWKVVASGFKEPTDIQFLPGQPRNFVVLEKKGKIWLVDLISGEKNLAADFTGNVETRSEEGLLGLAFHPDFSKNRRFYINAVSKESGKDQTLILEFLWEPQKILSWKDRKRVLLRVDQPYSNHNAGQLAFGLDGKLYIGFGDGGAANDPFLHGQNPNTFLGTLIRIEPNLETFGPAYRVPKDNPFLGKSGFLPEIWAYGLRNPWRFSFDSKTGELYVADVGQNEFEEVDRIEKGGNYGWNSKEGFHCFRNNPECKRPGLLDPIFEYDHQVGQSITGGYVYRGKLLPLLDGLYIFGDFVAGVIWALPIENDKKGTVRKLFKVGFPVSTFGQDSAGEIYFADFNGGNIYQLVKKN
ncbi:glucose/sorbosone dehydrogenase [Leptospira inadai serovar Lyme str. 10]|uniref:Glucose/sorbosone dehydrogenase n=2 Tax=Leptospira inadai serovar Lyme TaxID=293084 RepID=V6HBQ3_9LEPT|nr:PQQ-dependent sugar dehydrogenase [Leptospira inadai]EQA36108.1 glucose/sorbosone dehydrogenase [Leptospira inadai serovar Lyme str. 10]PNV74852.1 glucose dehydrogenase [Leptospira inadai serovar Lyme]